MGYRWPPLPLDLPRADWRPEGVNRLTQCRCWVRNLMDEEAFAVRFGAHDLQCPAYQRSRDPVDDVNDYILRRRMQVEYR